MTTTYVLKPRPPVRAFAIAAGTAVCALLLVVEGSAWSWPVFFVVLGWLLLACALGLLGAALWSMHRMRVFVDLDDDGYAISGAGSQAAASWTDVARVTSVGGGSRLVFYAKDGTTTNLVSPSGPGNREIKRLSDDLAIRLDASRGYRSVNPDTPPGS